MGQRAGRTQKLRPRLLIKLAPQVLLYQFSETKFIFLKKKRKNDKTRSKAQNKTKGHTFRVGKKKDRDQWYGYDNKDFRKWWHREGSKQYGINIDKETIEYIWREWNELGRTKVK